MVKIPKEYADIVRPCDDCGKPRPLQKVEVAGHVSFLCDTCIALLYDYCKNITGGWKCEGCENVHEDYTYRKEEYYYKDERIEVEYLRCNICGAETEIRTCDEEDDPEIEKWCEKLKLANKIEKEIEKIRGE